MNLETIFKKSKKKINKWSNYFEIYEKHFNAFIGKKILFLEIGVQNGGSLKMWRDFFGSNATIVGIDIDSNCKVHEDVEDNIHVRIGDQSDANFLQSIIDEFGIFTIVLDDGSHHAKHIWKSFSYLYPLLKNESLYMIEDLEHAYYPKSGSNLEENFINKTKHFLDLLNAHSSQYPNGNKLIQVDEIMTNNTFSINCYNGIICLEKRLMPERSSVWSS